MIVSPECLSSTVMPGQTQYDILAQPRITFWLHCSPAWISEGTAVGYIPPQPGGQEVPPGGSVLRCPCSLWVCSLPHKCELRRGLVCIANRGMGQRMQAALSHLHY